MTGKAKKKRTCAETFISLAHVVGCFLPAAMSMILHSEIGYEMSMFFISETYFSARFE